MRTYSVVFWNKTSAVVPDNWIDTEAQTFRWPKTKNPLAQIVKALPPGDDFLSFQYQRLVGTFDSYDKARDCEIDSQNISTNDEDGFKMLQEQKRNILKDKTRALRKSKRKWTSNDDGTKNKTNDRNKKYKICCARSSEEEEEETVLKIGLPLAPSNYVSKKEKNIHDFPESSHPKKTSEKEDYFKNNTLQDSHSDSDAVNDNDDESETIASSNNLVELKQPASKSAQETNNKGANGGHTAPLATAASTSTSNSITTNHGVQPISSSSISLQSTLGTDTNEACLGHACCEKIFAELESLKKTVSAMYMIILEKNTTGNGMHENKVNLELVIKSQNQLTEFENKLKNEVPAAQYKLMVKRIGGKTWEKHVRNALNLTLSNSLAYRMSWTGAKGTIMVKNMKFIEIIKDCIKDEWISATYSSIESVIKNWLQHAGDRVPNKQIMDST